MEPIVALDLFAGTGWGVACKRLGIEERGVELMAEAVATRTANGMETVYRDVWDGLLLSNEMHELLYGAYNLLIASPPCQTFSMAGNGAGRKALNEVIEAIQLHAYKVPQALLDFGKRHDMRTALVLTPLAYVYRDRPTYVAFEQVPTVRPVWEECAKIMREWGYSVKVDTLQAEQYGVPQTRKRAILVARLDGPVALPTPTHSRYYSANPSKLDPGVHKWVSMAEALGWNQEAQVGFPRLSDGREEVVLDGTAYRARDLRPADHPAQTVTEKARSWKNFDEDGVSPVTAEEAATLQSYPSDADVIMCPTNLRPNAAFRPADRPAPSLAFGHDNPRWITPEILEEYRQNGTPNPGVKLTEAELSALQSYPTGTVFRNGNQANAAVRPVDRPAPTLHFGQRSNKVEWMDAEQAKDPAASGERVTPEEAAALQTFPTGWGFTERPAVTVGNAVGRGLIGGSGAKETVVKALEDGTFIPSTNGDGTSYAEQTRITVEEAAALQTYPVGAAKKMGKGMVERHGERPGRDAGEPSFTVRASAGGTEPGGFVWEHQDGSTSKVVPDQAARIQTYPPEPAFIWCGTKSKVFLQIGNAVPPLLAQRILEALTEDIDLL